MNLARYFRATTADVDEVKAEAWNDLTWTPESQQTALIEQYKIYVEMADRVSSRRGLTNTFFLTLNTLIVTTFGTLWKEPPRAAAWYLTVTLLALLVQCASWFWLLRSYRQLNSAKYIVVGALEERLPASPYWRAEWKALGQGRDPSRYWPMSHLEQWIPVSFAALYIGAYVIGVVNA
ncbi:MAG TPA: hypothetical protein VN408_25315 [Actinoplanes sp.]|nr:hypothetical protein [Actinoplanes sp.]